VLEPVGAPALLTTKLPGPVNVWTLKFVQTVVIVPPVADINACPSSAN
jgi:hypothetical protein